MHKSRMEIVSEVWASEIAKPYTYGKADCFVLGCRMADTLARRKMVKTFGRAYSTLAGAQRALRRRGYVSLVGFFEDRFTTIGAAQAKAGDIGIAILEDGEHVCVCLGNRFGTKTEGGPRFLPMTAIRAAFRVA